MSAKKYWLPTLNFRLNFSPDRTPSDDHTGEVAFIERDGERGGFPRYISYWFIRPDHPIPSIGDLSTWFRSIGCTILSLETEINDPVNSTRDGKTADGLIPFMVHFIHSHGLDKKDPDQR